MPVSVGLLFLLAPLVPIAPAPATAEEAVVEIIMASGRFWPGDSCVVRDAGACVRVEETLTITQGTKLRVRNLDFVPHDLRSEAVTSTGRSVFASPRVLHRQSADVVVNTKDANGVPVLAIGTYRYYCTLHPPAPDGTGMRGTLKVVEG